MEVTSVATRNLAATDMTLPDTGRTRKQWFDAALALDGMTIKQWTTTVYVVESSYLHRVLVGEYPGGADLNAAINATIGQHFPNAINGAVPRATVNEDAVDARQAVENPVQDGGDVLGHEAA